MLLLLRWVGGCGAVCWVVLRWGHWLKSGGEAENQGRGRGSYIMQQLLGCACSSPLTSTCHTRSLPVHLSQEVAAAAAAYSSDDETAASALLLGGRRAPTLTDIHGAGSLAASFRAAGGGGPGGLTQFDWQVGRGGEGRGGGVWVWVWGGCGWGGVSGRGGIGQGACQAGFEFKREGWEEL